jgi:hypothetical protein
LDELAGLRSISADQCGFTAQFGIVVYLVRKIAGNAIEDAAVTLRSLVKARFQVHRSMVWFGLAIFSGSIMKGFLIGLICMILALFTTWRRFLEPLSFFLFCVAVAFWCDPQFLQRISASSAMSRMYAHSGAPMFYRTVHER